MNAAQAAVLLDTLGMLDESQRLALARARADDPVIRHLFRLLDPDSVDPLQPLIDLADRIAEEIRGQMGDADLAAVLAFQRLPEPERQTSPWAATLRLYDPRPNGGFEMRGSFPERMVGGTVKPLEFPLARQTTDYLAQVDDRVSLDCPEEYIPHGLGWLILTEATGVVTLRLPELSFDDGTRRWGFECNVEDLLAGRRPEDGELHIAFLPATEATRQAFDADEVRAFVASLSRWSTQRERAEKFLKSGSIS